MKDKGFLLWVAGFAGVLILYAAVKDKKISEILTQTTHGTTTPPGTATGAQSDAQVSEPSTTSSFLGNSVVTPDTPDVAFNGNGNPVNVPPSYASSPGTFVPSWNM